MRRLIFTGRPVAGGVKVLLASLVIVGLMGHNPQRALFPDPPDAAGSDYLSLCRRPVDLQKFNPLFPRSLYWILHLEAKSCGR